MYQTHSQPKQQQYIALLDKCTQILREDRIWLRNMVKSCHEQTISLFRGLPKNVDMKELQIKLRKFITRVKQRQKQQQLQRFKQNMQLPDFVQVAADRRQHEYASNVHQKDQKDHHQQLHQQYQPRRPLIENESNHEQRSSFVAKWNNYSHYNPSQHSNNQHVEGRQFQSQQQHQQQQQVVVSNNVGRGVTSSSGAMRKEWQNNYKPHSFNKNLNYELASKSSSKNISNILNNASTSKSKHNLSTSSLHKGGASREQFKNSITNHNNIQPLTNTYSNNASSSSRRQMMVSNQDNNEQRRMGGSNFGQGRGSSKSLKQIQNKIYQQLKQFQQNKNRRQSQSSMSMSMSMSKQLLSHQRSVDRQHSTTIQRQKSMNKYTSKLARQQQHQHPTTQAMGIPTPATVSKQSIDEILKFKLGNCDFESYKRQQSQTAVIHDSDMSSANHGQQQPSFCNISQLSHVSEARASMSSQKKMYFNNDSMFPPIEEQTERDSESQRYLEEPLRFGVNSGGNALRQELEDRHKMVFASFAKGGSAAMVVNELGLSKEQYGHSEDIMLNSFNPQQLASSRQDPAISINSPKQQLAYPKSISQSLYQSAQKQSDFSQNFINSDLHKSIMQSIKKSRQLYPLQQHNISNSNNSTSGPIQQPTTTSEVASFPSSLYSSTNQQSSTLFTSPQLLNECRNFLKKTQQINFENSGLSSNFNSSMKNTKFQSPTNSQQKKSFNFEGQVINNNTHNTNIIINNTNSNSNNLRFQPTDNLLMMNFPQPITITQSITKDYYENYGQSYSQAKINSMFQSKQSIVQKNIQFQTYSKPQEINQQQEVDGNGYGELVGEEGDGEGEGRQEEYMGSSGDHSNSGSLGKDYYQQVVVGKGSSSQKHSQIQVTLPANNNPLPPTSTQFSHHSRNHSSTSIPNPITAIPRHPYYVQSDQNYRTSEFKQIETDNRIVQHEDFDHSSGNLQVQEDGNELCEVIQIEDVIDRLLEANQGNLEMDSTWLKHTIANHCVFQPSVGNQLSHLLHEFIIQPGQTHNFIDLLDVVYAHYRASNPQYRPRKSPAADICSLLDIEEKGYIVQQDLHNFIAQLESAGVENIDEICQYLQETFEMADFLSIKRIGFVNLYVISKNEDCFDALWGELQQFEFEVEGDHQ